MRHPSPLATTAPRTIETAAPIQRSCRRDQRTDSSKRADDVRSHIFGSSPILAGNGLRIHRLEINLDWSPGAIFQVDEISAFRSRLAILGVNCDATLIVDEFGNLRIDFADDRNRREETKGETISHEHVLVIKLNPRRDCQGCLVHAFGNQ